MKRNVLISDVRFPKTKDGNTMIVLATDDLKTGDIVRNPRQMLIDLHNAGRAGDIPEGAFRNGLENATQQVKADFREACLELVGITASGDITERKAGDKYVISGNHPEIVAGKAKDGDTLVAEKDGVYVDGFLSLPLTTMERMNNKVAKELGKQFLAMYNIGAIAPPVVATVTDDGIIDDDDDLAPINEAISTTKAKK